MTAEERISQLERELAEERAKNARLQAELAALQAEHARLAGRLCTPTPANGAGADPPNRVSGQIKLPI